MQRQWRMLLVSLLSLRIEPRTTSKGGATHLGLGPLPSLNKKMPYRLAYKLILRSVFSGAMFDQDDGTVSCIPGTLVRT